MTKKRTPGRTRPEAEAMNIKLLARLSIALRAWRARAPENTAIELASRIGYKTSTQTNKYMNAEQLPNTVTLVLIFKATGMSNAEVLAVLGIEADS